jgi:hypothetical protein
VDFRDFMERLPDDLRGFSHGSEIRYAVQEGMCPFKMARMDLYYEYEIDYHRYVIVVELRYSELYGSETLVAKKYSNAFDMADNPQKEVARLAEEFKSAFRHREEWPVPDNIVLGEY